MILEVIRALVRRWYVLLLGIALTGAMVFGARTVSPPSYDGRGLVLMLPSKVAVGKGGNPLLALDGLEQPASILVAHYSSATAHEAVAAISPSAEFTVLLDATIRGPVIAVSVTDATPEATMAVLRHLIADIPKQLSSLQQQVQANSNAYIGSMPLSVDTTPLANRSATVRLMIAALVIGMVGTVLTTFALDSYLVGRRGARTRRSEQDLRGEDGAAAKTPDDPQQETGQEGTDPGAEGESRRSRSRGDDHRRRPGSTQEAGEQVGAGRS